MSKRENRGKTRVAVVFGGRSAEHEVSLLSARRVVASLDSSKYEVVLIGINRSGSWFLNEQSLPLLESADADAIASVGTTTEVSFVSSGSAGSLIALSSNRPIEQVDVIFPVLHGPDGEDGAVQGLARLAGIPCVSADVLGSAVAMDKDVAKRLLRDAGLKVAPFTVVRQAPLDTEIVRVIESDFGYPVFVKPANLGSSVGISKAAGRSELQTAVASALDYDGKALVEKAISGRELECGVLGNDDPITSSVGEIVVDDGFYTYEKKYIDEHGATLLVPAKLETATVDRLRKTAIDAFRVLEGRGMARVDMFLTPSGEIYINEVNTIPGFTPNSMYPLLFEHAGIPFAEVIDRLIELAIDDFRRRSARKTTPK